MALTPHCNQMKSYQSGRSKALQLAEQLRGVPEWNALGIDGQAVSLLKLPLFSEPVRGEVPEPVSYKECKPGPEHCDSEGRCWRFNPGNPGLSSPFLVHDSWVLSSREIGTHWLPHNTPCLPSDFSRG